MVMARSIRGRRMTSKTFAKPANRVTQARKPSMTSGVKSPNWILNRILNLQFDILRILRKKPLHFEQENCRGFYLPTFIGAVPEPRRSNEIDFSDLGSLDRYAESRQPGEPRTWGDRCPFHPVSGKLHDCFRCRAEVRPHMV